MRWRLSILTLRPWWVSLARLPSLIGLALLILPLRLRLTLRILPLLVNLPLLICLTLLVLPLLVSLTLLSLLSLLIWGNGASRHGSRSRSRWWKCGPNLDIRWRFRK